MRPRDPHCREGSATTRDPEESEANPGPEGSGPASPEKLGPSWRIGRGREQVRFCLHARERGASSLFQPRIDLYFPGTSRLLGTILLERRVAPEPWSLWVAEWEPPLERFEYLVRLSPEGPGLLDPYAPALAGGSVWGRSDSLRAPGVGRAYRGLLDRKWFEPRWRTRERAPRPRPAERVVCELHLRGFTRHPSSGVAFPGTYAGLVEKIPYLRSLGVTTVELLPVFEFDETEYAGRNPGTGERLFNFWGYSPVSFFAPKEGYASSEFAGAAVEELRLLVDEMHRAGLEVVLDVVYNHTAEGRGRPGDPLLAWRELDGDAYYLVDGEQGNFLDFTGCGHTVHVEHPVARRLVVDSLLHWVDWYDCDGFRFDLAGAFFRDRKGARLERSSLVDEIARHPVLSDRLLVAEPWDATGYSPIRGFPAPWRIWNGAFRDDVRRTVRGDPVGLERIARRLAGSPEGWIDRPGRSTLVDFVACHDGFPVADLVAYSRKHNEENGEDNRDGSELNHSANYGREGPVSDPLILALRARQRRNLLALWALSDSATILFPAGDEGGRTQLGNNNAWCQDNPVGWVVWSSLDPGEIEWFRALLGLRRRLSSLRRNRAAWLEAWKDLGEAPVPKAGTGREESAATTAGAATGAIFWSVAGDRPDAILALNFSDSAVTLPKVALPGRERWIRWLDTSLDAADGSRLLAEGREQPRNESFHLPSRSLRLWTRPGVLRQDPVRAV